MRFKLIALLALLSPALASAQSSTIERIRASKVVTMAYRTNALPFSFKDASGQPAGYAVELCKRIAVSMASHLNVPDLKIRWVEATSQNRFELIEKHQADMECGATTATLKRMEQVDFSNYVFVDSTGVLTRRAAGIVAFPGLAGKRIAVIAGTTNQAALDAALKRRYIDAKVVAYPSRNAAVAALEAEQADAFASDKVLLEGIAGKVKDAGKYVMLPDNLSFEPYAIALPRNDSALRLEVNRGLSQVFRSPAIKEIFERTFGGGAEPTALLQAVYLIGQIPE
jgi:ABC-type amino acid transport substrate-binding protein